MDYKKGDTVVVNVYGKNKVGIVVECLHLIDN